MILKELKILEENLDCNPVVHVSHTMDKYVSYSKTSDKVTRLEWTSDDVQELLWDSVTDNIIRIYQEHRLEGRL
tara:strand:- start:555 stop:776 length:222 start_codon:yes stop_codon:yes gene_type:complete